MPKKSHKDIPANWVASIDVEIPFHDVDMMAIAWHGHYVKYFELARCALFSQLDYDYTQMRDSGFAWPVIDLHVRYAQPARFQQVITVTATLVEYEHRLKVKYLVTDAQGKRLTKGHSIQVAVDMATEEMCFESPAILFEKIGIQPEDEKQAKQDCNV
ncbi:MAG: acyl-CoA thioesterase [Pseudomonadales bacterium]|nr:acyl-CoA thioesterase [Pseudomonadales bacterium]